MRTPFRCVALVMALLLFALPAAADKAKTVFEQGRDAEARQDYEKAYDLFRQHENDLWLGVEYSQGNDNATILTPTKSSFWRMSSKSSAGHSGQASPKISVISGGYEPRNTGSRYCRFM